MVYIKQQQLHPLTSIRTHSFREQRLTFGLELNVLKHFEDFNLKCPYNVLKFNC